MNHNYDITTQEYKDDINPKVWNFVSNPELHPMKVEVNVTKSGTDSGSIFVAPYSSYKDPMVGQTGALIMDQSGDPIWFRPLCSNYVQYTNFRVQTYFGYPVLTMWQGTISGTHASNLNLPPDTPEPGAYYTILNQNYNVIREITAQNGYTSDFHEFIITKRNTALFSAIKQIPTDLSPYNGPKAGYINDCSVQEIDLETGQLIFFWNALAHINPAGSMLPASSAVKTNNIWDCFHINSIDEGSDYSLLISMRNMCGIYKIDKNTGGIIWQLGGKKSNFMIHPDAAFSWQHDARYQCDSTISLFNNAYCGLAANPPQCHSHGVLLKLNFSDMTARAIHKYFHHPSLFVAGQGNIQKLSNKNQFIGWGQEPYLSEYAATGNTKEKSELNLLYDMKFPNKNISYRAFKNKWVGFPRDLPSIAVIQDYSATTVYASWNGSTETAAWQVLAGSSPFYLSEVIESEPRSGFETKIKVKSEGPFYQINALDANNRVIGSSKIIQVNQIFEL